MYDMGDDEEFVFNEVAQFEGVIVQHGLAGLMCMPSLLGLGGYFAPGVTDALAKHGGLAEVGWELQDTFLRFKDRFFGGEIGKKKNPTPLLIMFGMHHSCAQSLVLPMNIHYGSNKYYHEGVMLLQGAAFAAFMCQQYGFTLDIKTKSGLRQMKASVGLSWAVMMWSRCFRYGYVWWNLIKQFRQDNNSFCLKVALPPVIFMSLFNLAILADAQAKFNKFMFMRFDDHDQEEIEHHAVMALTTPTARRHPGSFLMTKSEKEWAKVRGAVKMGILGKEVQHKKRND